jgi:hypothetical protein
MSSVALQAAISGASGVLGAVAGGGAQLASGRLAWRDRRIEARESLERGAAERVLKGLSSLATAVYELQSSCIVLSDAMSEGPEEDARTARRETNRLQNAYKAATLDCLSMSAQIHDPQVRSEAVAMITLFTSIGESMFPVDAAGAWAGRALPLFDELPTRYTDVSFALADITRR